MELEQNKSTSPKNINEEQPIDARIRRIKDCILFFIALIMILGVFCFCVSVIFSARSLDEEKKWATITVTAIISGLLGYLVGKSGK